MARARPPAILAKLDECLRQLTSKLDFIDQHRPYTPAHLRGLWTLLDWMRAAAIAARRRGGSPAATELDEWCHNGRSVASWEGVRGLYTVYRAPRRCPGGGAGEE
jgi:hypothetical protein